MEGQRTSVSQSLYWLECERIRGMEHISEQEFILNHNKVYGTVLRYERQARKLSLEELSSGILSHTALDNVEKGRAQWTKVAGDTLMLRMGILPEYFESLASGTELERWRLREDICLLVPARPDEAIARIAEYRKTYENRDPLEEQFLLKAEAILMLVRQRRNDECSSRERKPQSRLPSHIGHTDAALVLNTARRAVECTVREGWEANLNALCLSPGELDTILLFCVALFLAGHHAKAWKLWQAVWNYPSEHLWKERAVTLILPQAAILGIWLALASKQSGGPPSVSVQMISIREMAAHGREALELLRRNSCHCYVLPLLESLCGLSEDLFPDPEYPGQLRSFLEMFREIYAWFDYPGYRIWQGISVDNTRDAGITLKMLRIFYCKSRENAVYDGNELVVTPRQLEKIERGIHKPSYQNYGRLAKQYGKYAEWNMPLLETDSVEILEQRQLISTLIECNDWEAAESEIRKFRSTVNPAFPRVRQELLFFDAALKWKKENALQESLDMMLAALHCTAPDFQGREMKWWVFQREEIMIASNIGMLYRQLGDLPTAEKWFKAILASLEENTKRTGIYNYGYDVAAENYDNYLGDIGCFHTAMKMIEKTIQKDLLFYRINSIQNLFYRIAWNLYMIFAEKPEEHASLRLKWKKSFRISESMADFMFDSHLTAFLKERESKYLS